jgi:mycothiol synthase
VITIRAVVSDADIDTYLEVRNRVHSENPMPRDVLVDERQDPDHLDLIAELDGIPVGAASASKFGGAPNGDLAHLAIRVPREHRRVGVGTALHRRASEHARTLGKARFYTVVRHDDRDSLAYFMPRGYAEVSRVQDVSLDVTRADVHLSPPPGIELVPLSEEHDRGAYEVAVEATADIPSGEQMTAGSYEQWHKRHFTPLMLRELSVVALEDGRVVGFAIAGRDTGDTAGHWMTGVARAARRRGIALALKQAQIIAAKRSPYRYLRAQNDLANTPMRRVNERLGYVREFEWIHLVGPLV